MNTSSNLDNEFNGIVNAAWKNDLETVKTMVTDGFNLATTNQYGESVLGETICYLCVYGDVEPHRFEVVKLLLALGANPNQHDSNGCGALQDAIFAMDTELIKILLDAGAKPNDFSNEYKDETLYSWGVLEYQFHIWDVNKFPEEPNLKLLEYDEEKWLNWFDAMAIKDGRRRPDHLFLLREYGARTLEELKEQQ
jgi:hypothetical protein